MRFVVYTLFGFIAILLETSFFPAWPTEMLRLELVWILFFYVALTRPLPESLGAAVFFGLLEDMAGTPFVGFFVTLYLLIVMFLRLFMVQLFFEALWSRLVWLGLFSFVLLTLEWGLLKLIQEEAGLRFYVLTYGVLQSVMNIGIAALLFPLLSRMEKWIGARTRGTQSVS